MNKTIFLIAGHHLKDSGASANGYKENELTVEFRNLVYQRIKQLDPNVKVWIDNDSDTLSQVISKVRNLATEKDILLDIHFNSFNSKSTGSEALVSNSARQLSKDIAKEVSYWASTILGITDRGVKTEAQSARGSLGIFKTKASTALLEIAFISNPSDMEKYQKNKHWFAEEVALMLILFYKAN